MRSMLVTTAVFIFAGIAINPVACAAPMASKALQTTTQLPRNVRPVHYDVALVPDAKAMTFTGKVAITIDVLQPTASVILNAVDLNFLSVMLTSADNKIKYGAPKVQVDPAAQNATFTFARIIPKGRYRLALDYTGKIGTQATGMFALNYDSATGPKRALYTQFENSDARSVIPSWDEPTFKTTFSLEATVPSGEMAVSNMPVSKQSDLGDGRTLVRFMQSPKMSTYLLFFALGEFERATTNVDGTELGVVTKRGGIAQAAFALDSSKLVLREYNDYFGVRYPLPKLDNVAAPGRSQFFSAMENWGAIFTFERRMLLDPSISTQADKQRLFEIVAHETAHQWFGDLVTMRWWDDLWLNEGFASWMERRTTRRLHPEWNTALTSVNVRERAMIRDALKTTHPVVQHVDTVEQASQAFDDITYDKGESVIGMLEAYVGSEGWRSGVRRYMRKHAYGNTISDDLWREIEAAAHQPITAIAHDFTLQSGVPMIRVESVVCHESSTMLHLTQTEFSNDQPDKKPLAWRVPVVAQVLGGTMPVRTLVAGGQATLKVPGCGPVIVNAGQSGYYRTLYAPEQFQALAKNFAALKPIDQLGLMSDTWSLGLAGLQPVSDFLDLAKATPLDADPQIWGKIADVFTDINDYYDGDPLRQKTFRKFAIGRLSPIFTQIGWIAHPGESGAVAILRNELVDTLSALGDTAVIDEARRRYAEQESDSSAVPAALRKAIVAVVARHADAAMWDRLHAAALGEKTPLVKAQLYELLAWTEDENLARLALDLAMTQEPGATNSAAMLSRVAGLHPDLAFDFAVAHNAAVNEKIDATSRSRYFPRLTAHSADPAMIGKLNAYAVANLPAGSRRDVDTAVANIIYRIKVRKERLPVIDAWLTGI